MLATVLGQSHLDLFVAPLSDLSSGHVQQITTGARLRSFAWTPDGQMILDEDALNLFNPGTGSKTPLTSPKQDGVVVLAFLLREWPLRCVHTYGP